MTRRPEMDLSISPYLQGSYAPVLEEYDFDQGAGGLRVEGEIPDESARRVHAQRAEHRLAARPLRVSRRWRWHGARRVLQGWPGTLPQPLGAHRGLSGRGKTRPFLLRQHR